jgi:hypothetical protein
VIWPPGVPTYFNAGHRLPLFVVGAHLRALPSVRRATCVDAGALNYTWKEIGNLLAQSRPDVIAIMNEFGQVEGVAALIQYARHLVPRARIITFGRLSSQVPGFFKRFDLDAIVLSGDYEAGVAAYVESPGAAGGLAGVSVRVAGGGWSDGGPGAFLPPNVWAEPDIDEIPYEHYDRINRDDANKFCAIPQRSELVVQVGRGCPINCEFCEVPRQQGARDRRRSVESVIAFIDRAFARRPFEYVSMYCPTFTLDRPWVEQLCTALIERRAPYRWKCVTTLHHLDEALVGAMARAGCVRISVGLETLDPPEQVDLPSIKRIGEVTFHRVADWCERAGVELNCFVILGLPGQTAEGARHTAATVRSRSARLRPTIYTPYHQLRPDMSTEEVLRYDRQFFLPDALPGGDAAALYALAYGPEPAPTRVFEQIPRRDASRA